MSSSFNSRKNLTAARRFRQQVRRANATLPAAALRTRYLFLVTGGNDTKPVKVNFWTRRLSGFSGVTSAV
jgi:hypothetical protein